MEKKKQPNKSAEKPKDEIHHKKVEHDQEIPTQERLSDEEKLDIIPGDEEIVETPPPGEPPPPGEGP
jgi:hypothetical protein